jgi:hypothetical protein
MAVLTKKYVSGILAFCLFPLEMIYMLSGKPDFRFLYKYEVYLNILNNRPALPSLYLGIRSICSHLFGLFEFFGVAFGKTKVDVMERLSIPS